MDNHAHTFRSARLKLTAWYLLIITLISLLFSVAIYSSIDRELIRFQHFQELRQQRYEQDFGNMATPPEFLVDTSIVDEARTRLIISLALINVGILVLAGGAGYFLAGRTLRPIKVMLDEQNRFIADASHELKTPLTALRTEIEIYLRDKRHALSRADALIKSNLEEVINLQGLSEHLMKLMRYQNGTASRPSSDSVPITAVMEDALKRVVPMAREKHITITNAVGDEVLVGDRQSLAELFVIILDNAVKYSHTGDAVEIVSTPGAHHTQVRIKDPGIGIAPEDLPRIFDRFYRADASRSRSETPGYGLGLPIAKQIADMHQGSVSVQSQQGKGTTVTVQLPIASPK